MGADILKKELKNDHAASIFISYYQSSIGELILGEFEDQLCLCDWRYRKQRKQIDNRIKNALNANFVEKNTDFIRKVEKQLNEYFSGQRKEFDIPILLLGTPFQIEVWNSLQSIPYGQCISYKKLSQNIGNIQAIRAVSTANGANALSIIVPCHRVIGSDGKLVGYAGGLDGKRKLLAIEGHPSGSEQLSLF